MQVHLVVAPVFATNCCVVVDGEGDKGVDAVVVDAGAGVAPSVSALVAERGWRVRAVLATHGHVDHTWDAAALCERYEAPLRIHAADAYRLADPFGTLGLTGGPGGVSDALRSAIAGLGLRAEDYRAPDNVVPFDAAGDDGAGGLIAGALRLGVRPAPGHTEGSTLYLADGVVLAGDVLFAGGIGRTDLPGGDDAVMRASLSDVVMALDGELGVVPGHGPTTTVARELATNPYLRGL
ncbi:MBL fold metallo-hydrolase [Xylanimonas ulmi]|uniref:Glyoxylase-like metal-dependent hydrolase (Beta-lactamase superfamily II) n=1 Tax=Xylanimonas ulmi TaxID=228973 RepID=A0A4Q7LZT0_9MICO|nr:MBL fold metallo-hydrolase [Xylanibacterium ulmi]RZS60956.1 glyoxylase-like metal-dependent hydrolase (beta-lactamase superfamily II) [Xylanibacterium ulmi]